MHSPITRRGMLGVAASAAATWMTSSARADEVAAGPTLIFICLRGGADGLSLLVPYTEEGYYRSRPRIAIAAPGGGTAAAVRLDERFALHPCLASWQGWFEERQVGARVGVGPKAQLRSHRAAQAALDDAIVQALGGAKPELLRGPVEARLHELATQLKPEAPRAVLLESLGWDTHSAQGRGTTGRLASVAKELERALVGFRRVVGNDWQHVRLAVVTEFGRTLTESRTGGTDDAYASLLFTFGPRQSGRVLGSYGTLEPGCAYDERARAPTVELQAALESFVQDA